MVGSPGWSRGPLPPVTPLTLSSPTKATLLWVILWRSCATAEHGIAQATLHWFQSAIIRCTAGVGGPRGYPLMATVLLNVSSRPEEFHLRALPEPCMTLSSHTAPDVRPLP